MRFTNEGFGVVGDSVLDCDRGPFDVGLPFRMLKRTGPASVEEEEVDIRQEILNRVDLTIPTPTGFMIACPFHDDSTPSLGVDTHRGIFHCFACGESGNIYKLLAGLDGVSVDAIREKYQEEWRAQAVIESLEESIFGDSEDPAYYMPRAYKESSFKKAFPPLSSSVEGTAYMSMRGLSRETILRFDLRWGLSGKYKDRVIIPIYDRGGRLISYTGRSVIPGTVPKTRKPAGNKALSTLFGIHHLLAGGIDNRPRLILVEGEIDAMYVSQFGYDAVATMGTSRLTKSQADLVVEMAKDVTLMFDGDDAGRKATEETKRILSPYIRVLTVQLPEGKDPNDLSREELSNILRATGRS
jgi:DNA primase